MPVGVADAVRTRRGSGRMTSATCIGLVARRDIYVICTTISTYTDMILLIMYINYYIYITMITSELLRPRDNGQRLSLLSRRWGTERVLGTLKARYKPLHDPLDCVA